MRNAMVIVDHHGDNGTVSAGMILKDVGAVRFTDLEKAGLVREATTDELKDGYKPPFTPEAAKSEPTPDNKQAPTPDNKQAPAPGNKQGSAPAA